MRFCAPLLLVLFVAVALAGALVVAQTATVAANPRIGGLARSIIAGTTKAIDVTAWAAAPTSFYVDAFGRPVDLPPTKFDAVPIGVSSVCPCVSVAQPGARLTLDQIGALLKGNGSTIPPSLRTFQLALTMNSSITLTVQAALVRSGDNTFVSGWPSAVLMNPAVIWQPTDEAVAQTLLTGNATFGFVSLFQAVQFSLACLPVASSSDVPAVSPRLVVANTPSIAISGTDAVPKDPTMYPLIGTINVYYPKPLSCAASYDVEAIVDFLTTSSKVAVALQAWGALPLAVADRMTTRAVMYASLSCMRVTPIAAGGSTAAQIVVSAWSEAEFLRDNTTHITYAGVGSGAGLTSLKKGDYVLAVSDSPLTAAERSQYPTLTLVPATSFAVSIVHSLSIPGIALTIPRCTVVKIFTGMIRMWNDSELTKLNPTVILPPEPIALVVRGDRSGTVQTFLGALKNIRAACVTSGVLNNASVPAITATSTYNLFASKILPSQDHVVSYLRTNPNAMSFAAAPNSRSENLQEASLSEEATGTITSPQDKDVQVALADAKMNPTTFEMTFPISEVAYPIVGVSYYVFDTSRPSGCPSVLTAAKFIIWTITDATAQAISASNNFQPIPSSVFLPALVPIHGASCGGALLFPKPVNTESILLMSIMIPVALIFLIVSIVVGFIILRHFRKTSRANHYAPQDASQPVAIVFTDIQSSTRLWALVPEIMAGAVDLHHEIIRACIAEAEAYEVKTVGDSFMIACKSTETAVRLALDIQTHLHAADWGSKAIDDAYQNILLEMSLLSFASSPAGTPTNQKTKKDGASVPRYSVWNGLRVRIGVHCGVAQIKFDEITKGYDYYGTVVNTAARVEDIGHGGQVLVTGDVTGSIPPEFFASYAVREHGFVPLRGLTEPTEIFEVATQALSQRSFPPLRLDHEFTKAEEVEDPTTASGSAYSAAMRNLISMPALRTAFSVLPVPKRREMLRGLCSAWRLEPSDLGTAQQQCDFLLRKLAQRVDAISSQKKLTADGRRASTQSTEIFPIDTSSSTLHSGRE